MKTFLTVLISSFFCISVFGQSATAHENGAYATFIDFQNNTPTYKDTFVVIKRTKGDIQAWGGNDYKLECNNDQIKKKILKNQLWGVVVNDTLYINGKSITGGTWYSKVDIFGKYCLLRTMFPSDPRIQKALGLKSPSSFGYMFGAIGGGIQGAKMAMKRIPLIFCMSDGQMMLLSKTNMLDALSDQKELQDLFMAEKDQENEDTLLKYLLLLNEKEK